MVAPDEELQGLLAVRSCLSGSPFILHLRLQLSLQYPQLGIGRETFLFVRLWMDRRIDCDGGHKLDLANRALSLPENFTNKRTGFLLLALLEPHLLSFGLV